MSREELRETLASLHTTLGDTSDVDADTRKLLLSVTDDIQRLLKDDDTPVEADDSLTERIDEMAREFDVNHPILGGMLQRISDGLANIGI